MANLTPFGFANSPVETNPYALDAYARAQVKLNALRAGVTREPPAGGMGSLVQTPIALLVLVSLPTLLAGMALVADRKSGSLGAGAICLAITAALIGLAVWLYISARANTPRRAVKYFFKAAAQGKASKLSALVVSNDFDEFPRFPPPIAGFGQGAVRPFFKPAYLEGYWIELVRYHAAPYCIVSLHGVREQELAPDLVMVECQVRFIMNTQLWLLLFLIAGLLAVIVDVATRKTVRVPVRKLLYKVGDEWKLFNGELQGVEEQDLCWLQDVAPLPTARSQTPYGAQPHLPDRRPPSV